MVNDQIVNGTWYMVNDQIVNGTWYMVNDQMIKCLYALFIYI